jgi:hypothetical protein
MILLYLFWRIAREEEHAIIATVFWKPGAGGCDEEGEGGGRGRYIYSHPLRPHIGEMDVIFERT